MSRQAAERFGRRAEWAAKLYLRALFFRILATRVRTPVGEIDLIARRGNSVLFVEVKARTRRADRKLAPATVNRRRIVAAAHHWLSRNPWANGLTLRFDVIALAPFSWPVHVRDAFDASEHG